MVSSPSASEASPALSTTALPSRAGRATYLEGRRGCTYGSGRSEGAASAEERKAGRGQSQKQSVRCVRLALLSSSQGPRRRGRRDGRSLGRDRNASRMRKGRRKEFFDSQGVPELLLAKLDQPHDGRVAYRTASSVSGFCTHVDSTATRA